jgi:hypothetical protein
MLINIIGVFGGGIRVWLWIWIVVFRFSSNANIQYNVIMILKLTNLLDG